MSRVICYAALLLLGLGVITAYEIKNVGWWKNTPFYQIYPRSFMDSDNDGIGDLNGITSKLEHFVDAGIGAIWLSPIYSSPMKDFGYDISNFTEIQGEYGTMADFEKLTARAKELKLKVILDLVPNHASDKHVWFAKSVKKEAPYKDYFIWKAGNETTPPNNWISVFGKSAWTFHPERKEWYFHQFLAAQPDLNYNNPAVKNAMNDVILFWLGKGVNGFRIDAVPHLFEVDDFKDEPLSGIPGAGKDEYTYLNHIYTKDQPKTYELVKSWRKVLDEFAWFQSSDELVMMTEAYTSLNKTVEFYDAGAHVPFNFKFITDVNNTSPPSAFKKLIDTWMKEAYKRNGTGNWVMGNHDRSRTESRYPKRGDHMTMLAMILPGVSVTYYGEEIGMVDKTDISWEDTQDPQGCQAGKEKYKEQSRDPCRTPFQWDNSTNAGFSKNDTGTWIPVHQDYVTLNLAAQKKMSVSHFSLFRNLTKLKTTSPAVANGTLNTYVKNNDQVLVIKRSFIKNTVANASVLLVMNFNKSGSVTVNLKDEIASNIALNGTIMVATLESTLQTGAFVNLTNLILTPNTSLVILADQLRPVTNIDGGNGSGGNAVSFIKATVILFATLLMTFR